MSERMTPERWRQVTEVFHAARTRDARERAAFLDDACADDRALREEVDAMLAAHHEPGEFGDPTVSGSFDVVRRLETGAMVGPYRIDRLIGAGGMGEVYRARDTKLGRDVAIKVLPDTFTSDPERLRRFEREARVLAALNHPHIAAIYGFEEADPSPGSGQATVRALVLELVEGETLADRLKAGPLTVSDALAIADQIADALEAAHEKGIIHRDLKPANIILQGARGPTPTRSKTATSSVDSPPRVSGDVNVKVLDFGLAKAFVDGSNPDLSQLPTLTVEGTREGVIAGTPAYMSPEAARGRAVDKRTDIWAFGCVLYEMLAGKRAFRGETVSETLAEVLKSEPQWTALPSETPVALRNVIRRCLEKEPRQRVRDIGDVRLALEEAFPPATAAAVGTTAVAVSRLRVWQRRAAAVIIAVSLVAAGGLAVWTLTRPSPAAPVRLTVTPPAGETVGVLDPAGGDVAISPDGRRIVFLTRKTDRFQLYVRALDQLEAQPLQGPGEPRGPFMSPDGNWVGFFDEPDVLRKVAVNGGPAVTICNANGGPRGASWGSDDTIVFATNDPATGLLRVSAAGGEADVLTKPDAQKGERDHYWPELLPGGKAVLFTILSTAGGIETAQIAVLDLQTGKQRLLVTGGSHPRYVPTGHIVYGVPGTLRAVAFDLDRLEVRSDPVPVLQRVVTKSEGAASFSVARDGSLVYLAGDAQVGLPAMTLVWVDRQGREEAINAPPRAYGSGSPRISPDGTRVAIQVFGQDQSELDIWIWDLTRQTLTRLTFDPAQDTSPVWTPDGRRLVFASERNGPSNLFWQAADGTGAVERLTDSANEQEYSSFSPDGTRLLFTQVTSTTGLDIGILPLEGERPSASSMSSGSTASGGERTASSGGGESVGPRRATLLVQSTFNEGNPQVSPDGRWLAHQSDESGRVEIYVRPFPDVDSGRWQVSTGGGTGPLWARSGKELFYLGPSSAVMSVAVAGGSTFRAGNPTRLFEWPYFTGAPTYDVSPDGRRFLMIKPIGSPEQTVAPTSLIVVQHWFEELKRLVPTK